MAKITGSNGSCEVINTGRGGKYPYDVDCSLKPGKDKDRFDNDPGIYKLTKEEAVRLANKYAGANGSSKSSSASKNYKKHGSNDMELMDWVRVGGAGLVVVGGIVLYNKLSGK